MRSKNHKKALFKVISWRIISSVVLFALATILGVEWKVAGSLALIDTLLKSFLMYLHELAWQGRMKPGGDI